MTAGAAPVPALERECAAGCGQLVRYDVQETSARHAPEVAAPPGTTAYAGGHLCVRCSVGVAMYLVNRTFARTVGVMAVLRAREWIEGHLPVDDVGTARGREILDDLQRATVTLCGAPPPDATATTLRAVLDRAGLLERFTRAARAQGRRPLIEALHYPIDGSAVEPLLPSLHAISAVIPGPAPDGDQQILAVVTNLLFAALVG